MEVGQVVDAELELKPISRRPPARTDAGVVDEHVDAVVTIEDLGRRLGHRSKRGEVDLHPLGGATDLLDLPHQGLELALGAAGRDHVAAHAAEGRGGGSPYAGGESRDQNLRHPSHPIRATVLAGVTVWPRVLTTDSVFLRDGLDEKA